jgi:hypothetical protein
MSATNFRPDGSTLLCNVSTTSSSVYVTSTSQQAFAWLITNAGTTDCFFRISTNPSVVCSVPITANTSQAGQLINAGDTYIVGLPVADGNGPYIAVSNVTVAANCYSLGTSTQLFVTPVQPFIGA